MKKEKAIRINLPEGAEYRRVEVTDDGISIIYAEETANDTVKVSKTVSKAIPKPTPLIGGTEVYQKEGLPYWYCKIKDGRDEFMHLYFGDLTNNDILYTEDGKKREFVTERQKKFRADVMKALENMPEEGFRWIPVYEPSKDNGGNIQYVYRSIPQQLLCVLEADACQKLCEGAACGLFDQAGCMLRGVMEVVRQLSQCRFSSMILEIARDANRRFRICRLVSGQFAVTHIPAQQKHEDFCYDSIDQFIVIRFLLKCFTA